MSKDLEKPDLENRLIVFAVRIIRIAESLPKKEFNLIFVLSFVASLKLIPWNELPIRIPRGEVLLKPRAQRSSNREAFYFIIRHFLFEIRYSLFTRRFLAG